MKTIVIKETIVKRRGIGFLGALTIVLVILKATGFLEEVGWLWVFSPLWLPIVTILGLAIIIYVFLYIAFSVKKLIRMVK